MTHPKRTPIRTRSAFGKQIVRVPLANHDQFAVLDAEDYDRLMLAGFTSNWTFNNASPGCSYVRAHCEKTHNLVTVSRLIVEAGPGQAVRYRDKNPMNLRRDNLYFSAAGHAKHFSPLIDSENADDFVSGTPKHDMPADMPAPASVKGTVHGLSRTSPSRQSA